MLSYVENGIYFKEISGIDAEAEIEKEDTENAEV